MEEAAEEIRCAMSELKMLKDPKWPVTTRDRILYRAVEGNEEERSDSFRLLTIFLGRCERGENERNMWEDEDLLFVLVKGIRDRSDSVRRLALQVASQLGATNPLLAWECWGEEMLEAAESMNDDQVRKQALIGLALYWRDLALREKVGDRILRVIEVGIVDLDLDFYEEIELKGILKASEDNLKKKSREKSDEKNKENIFFSEKKKQNGLCRGARARVKGLKKDTSRNGCIGILASKAPDKDGRWALELEVCSDTDATHLKLKAEHLELMPPLETSIEAVQAIIDHAPPHARIRLPAAVFSDKYSQRPNKRTELPVLHLRNKKSLFLIGDHADAATYLCCRLLAHSSVDSLRMARITIDGGMDLDVANTTLQRVRLDSPHETSSTLAITKPNVKLEQCVVEGGDYGIAIHAEFCSLSNTLVLGARKAGIFASVRFRAEYSTVKCCLDQGIDAKLGYDEVPDSNRFQVGPIKPVKMPGSIPGAFSAEFANTGNAF